MEAREISSEIIAVMKDSLLCEGLDEAEIRKSLECMGIRVRQYKKGDVIYKQGSYINSIGVLVKGGIHMSMTDYSGNRSILLNYDIGDLIAPSFVCARNQPLTADLLCIKDCWILVMDYQRLIAPCAVTCKHHIAMVNNLLAAISERCVVFHNKSLILSERQTRNKLLSFLTFFSLVSKSSTVILPFNRQQLADFLAVDRSAMCSELTKMRKEGLIEYNKNMFVLKYRELSEYRIAFEKYNP